MITPQELPGLYVKHGSLKAVMRETGETWHQVHKAYEIAVQNDLMTPLIPGRKNREQMKDPSIDTQPPEGRVHAIETSSRTIPEPGSVNRYILTCAQNETLIHEKLWTNLLALKDHYNAELMVSRFTYVRSGLGTRGDKANVTGRGNKSTGTTRELNWDSRIEPYLEDGRIELAPGLVWCGEMNILPTAVNPLTGLEVYTGRASGIFPHVKLAMASIPSGKFEPTKFNYTTGTLTLRNYIQRKAGLKAEFHHCYGALLVEVDSDGDWFVRQLNADSDGILYDLNLRVDRGEVTEGHWVEGINWGDLHGPDIPDEIHKILWGVDGILDTLGAKYQFFHDFLSFVSRNHHDMKDPFRRFEKHVQGIDDVEAEVNLTMRMVAEVAENFPNTEIVVVDSNHDRALERWLRESDWRSDPLNMVFYMKSVLAKLEAIQASRTDFHMMRHWFYWDQDQQNVRFLDEDESFVICPDRNGGIECGMHGHHGPNGAYGNPSAFAKMGRKANTGHTHQAGIKDGIYTAGISNSLDQLYNIGPSSWSLSEILTYLNGKRSIITLRNGKWRAVA
jgi:hypothetical protein